MAAHKFLKNASGQIAEEAAVESSAGAGDEGKIVALNSSGQIDLTMMPTGIGPDTESMVTSENLAAGNLVNIYDVATVKTARKADASNGRRAHGFVLAASVSPAAALVYLGGKITGLSGLTNGAAEYLSDSAAGTTTETAPTTAAHIVQEVGYAVSATELQFIPQQPITLA